MNNNNKIINNKKILLENKLFIYEFINWELAWKKIKKEGINERKKKKEYKAKISNKKIY